MPNLPHEDIHERILELFVDEFTLLNASDVAEKAKIQRITATKHLKRFENDGVVKIAYCNEKIRLYRIVADVYADDGRETKNCIIGRD